MVVPLFCIISHTYRGQKVFCPFAPGIIIVLDSLTNYNPFTGKNLRQKMPEARSCVSYFAWI